MDLSNNEIESLQRGGNKIKIKVRARARGLAPLPKWETIYKVHYMYYEARDTYEMSDEESEARDY